MSYISVQGEQSDEEEIEALTNLAALNISSSSQFIRKTGPTTFANAEDSGGTINVEGPTGLVNGSNVTFTVTNTPIFIVIDGLVYFENFGYTFSGGTITTTTPPFSYIKSIHS